MALKASYEFLFFGKEDGGFLENYSYDLLEDHGEKSGQIFINLEIQHNPMDAEEIGSVVFETMQKVFFEDMSMQPYDRFEKALKSVNDVLEQFRGQKVSGYIGNLNVIVAAIVGDTLFLSQAGDSEAYLVRKGYVSVVTEGLSDESSTEVFSSIASGKLEPQDFVIFSSTRLLRYISKSDLARLIRKRDVVEDLSEIKDVVSAEILGRIGLTGIMFEKVSDDEVAALQDEASHATKSTLEADGGGHVIAEKQSLTGRFVTALKAKKRKKGHVASSGPSSARARKAGAVLGKVKHGSGRFFKGLFSKGFGKDKILAVLILVIVVLSVGILISNGQSRQKEEIVKLDAILVGVQEKIAEAETKGSYDKETAKDLLDSAYNDALTVLQSEYYRDKANSYLIQIETLRDTLDNVKRIENPVPFADLTEKRTDVNALGIVAVGDRVFAYESNALYELVLDQVQDPITIDDDESVISATGFADRGSIVFLTKSGKLIEYRDGTISFMDTDDGTFHKGVDLADWSNRIYLLDPDNNQIWRYPYRGTRESFGSAEAYLGDGADLSDAKSIAIDASVYVQRASGDINKFYGGSKVEFLINKAPVSLFNDPTKIFTNENLDQIYVLDSASSRVLVFDKDYKTGNVDYATQYYFTGVGELRDIYVDEYARDLYVITATAVYKVALTT